MLDRNRLDLAIVHLAHVVNEVDLNEADERHLHVTLGLLDELRDSPE